MGAQAGAQAGAAQVGPQAGPQAGAAQVGAQAGAQQVGAHGAQQLLWQRVRQRLQRSRNQLPQRENMLGRLQQVGAGAQQLTGAGAQQVTGAGAQQDCFWQPQSRPNQPAFTSLTLAQQTNRAADRVNHFIIRISWKKISVVWPNRLSPPHTLGQVIPGTVRSPTVCIAVWDSRTYFRLSGKHIMTSNGTVRTTATASAGLCGLFPRSYGRIAVTCVKCVTSGLSGR